MNFVSYETAVRLKEAGFPQPKPMFYQLWYSPNGESEIRLPYYISPLFGGASMIYNSVFAPTAPDILRELGSSFSMFFREEDKVFEPERESVFIVTCDSLFVKPNIHENPAEAAALAWFEANGK